MKYKSYNNSLLYYKHYYYLDGIIEWDESTEELKEKNRKSFKRANEALFDTRFPSQNPYKYPEGLSFINLCTTYPGLLLGSGITHESGLSGELKLGFFFDHTTGLPVIPGSSVKGVLRSAFPQGSLVAKNRGKKTVDEKNGLDEKAGQLAIYIGHQLKEITNREWTAEEIDELETFIFGSYQTGSSDTPMSQRIIFHDAVADHRHYTAAQKQPYLGDDYITPHNKPFKKDKKSLEIPGALRNPIPIAFIKVLPGVTFRFQFVLHPFKSKSTEDAVLCIEQMKSLFSTILQDFGVGAKTNTGYGHLERAPDVKPAASRHQDATFSGKKAPEIKQHIPSNKELPIYKLINSGDFVICRVAISKRSGNKVVKINIKGKVESFICSGLDNYSPGELIIVEVLQASLAGGIDKVGNPKTYDKPNSD